MSDSRSGNVDRTPLLICGICNVCKFDTANELENHEKICDGLYKEIFTCDVCKVAHFDTIEEAIAHENQCMDKIPSAVDFIEPTYKRSERIDQSARRHHGVKVDQSTRQHLDRSPKQQGSTVFVTIPPGRIGLTLKLNKALGGATVTKIEADSTTGGRVDVDDRIISIDGHTIVSIEDYAINQGKIRILEVVKTRAKLQERIIFKSLKHALFSQKPLAGDSSNIFTPDVINNTLTVHNPRVKKSSTSNSLSLHLRPVEIPFDPLDENFDYSLERELAWLIEESAIILPQLTQNCTSQPFVLDYAWRHCSFELRLAIQKAFPRAANGVVKNLKVDMTDQDIREKYCREDCVTVVDANLLELLDKERIRHLREDVQRVVFNLGFRRSSSIERELNLILNARIGEIVGEVATNKPPRRQRIRRKRLLNDDFIMTSDEVNLSFRSTAKTLDEMVCVAVNVPPELSPLEDEVAFLVEESLILLPDELLANSADNTSKTITSIVSAGLSTQHDDSINWKYVCANASEQLKEVLYRVGIKRRPLQRIIRYHELEVRVAFERRRVEICELLVIDGYRRQQTTASLPSNELLEQVGLLNVMKVRLKYRLRSSGSSHNVASKKDLRMACSIRNKKQRTYPKKKAIAIDFTKVDLKRHAVLNTTERELAFLREEFESEYEHSCYDWDYIEKRSSQQLRQIMAEKKVAPLIANPSVAGVSKLKKLVRIEDSNEVKQAFSELRRDIRYALLVGFKRDSPSLPDLPPAPPVNVSRGKYVIDVEHRDCDISSDIWPTTLFRGEWKCHWLEETKDM